MSHAIRSKNYRLGLLRRLPRLASTRTAPNGEVPTIGEIVVTAQRREESNSAGRTTLTALSGDALALQRVEQVLDLKGRVPNLDIKEQVPARAGLTIRGVGLNDFGAANSPSAGVYVDRCTSLRSR
jgi:iron complex outermembrane receptor protein